MKFDVKKFYFEDGLYLETAIEESDFQDLFRLIYYSSKVDAYCPLCERDSIFKAEPVRPKRRTGLFSYSHEDIFTYDDFQKDYNFSHFSGHDFRINFKCIREEYLHRVCFITRVESDRIFKIGQFPSVADLAENFSSKKYSKVLDKNKIQELNKAIGLNSHGIGIGAFVYLRRTFEYLIEETHTIAKNEVQNWNDQVYMQARMNERIDLLQNFLPDFLVENKNIYGILSKGIHELEENYCKEIFPILKASIEFILDEKVAQSEKAKKVKETGKILSKIARDIKEESSKKK